MTDGKVFIAPYPGDGWSDLGWSYDGIVLEHTVEHDEIKGYQPALQHVSSIQTTVSFDLDPEAGWIAESIYNELNVSYGSYVYTVVMHNLLTGEKRWIKCQISAQAAQEHDDIPGYILDSCHEYLTPKQVESVKILMDNNDKWLYPKPYATGGYINGHSFAGTWTTTFDFSGDAGHSNQAPKLSKMLPAVNEYVTNPVTKVEEALRSVIIDLNDHRKWSREKIADWIETLDIDTTFKVPADEDLAKAKQLQIEQLAATMEVPEVDVTQMIKLLEATYEQD